MNGNPEKIIRISEYIQGLLNKENGRQLYDRYQDAFEEVGPQDLFGAFYRLMEKGLQPKELLGVLDKVINVAYEGLSAHPWKMPAIIGRDVDKCHPPESVHMVHQIVESFRSGNRDTATFWINLKGKMILIQYFALRNSEGQYKGVLEVSQDITEIKSLEGERRLLQWED